MPTMAVSRIVRAGCSTGFACNWARMSGDAFTNAQALPASPVTAIEDWVRARVWREPLRTPAQLRQLQFHCGKPPPAAEPNTRIFNRLHRRAGSEPGRLRRHRPPQPARLLTPYASALGDVHRDFHTEPEISRLRSFPFHKDAPDAVNARTPMRTDTPILPYRATLRIRPIMKVGS